MTRAWGIAIALVACGDRADPTPASAPHALDAAPAPPPGPAPDAAPPADCGPVLGRLRSDVHRAFVAKDAGAPYHDAIEAWPAVPPACRTGAWYLAAAKLIVWGRSEPLEAPGVVLRDRDEALAAAIQQPADVDVLVHVAFVAALGGTTALPPDACAVAEAKTAGARPGAELREATDDARYICGHAALVAGDAATARDRFAAIEGAGFYVDLDLRRAQAAKLLGDRAATRRFAKQQVALDWVSARAQAATDDDWKALADAARALLR